MKKKVVKAIDVLSHALVPEMAILSNEEKTRLLKKFGISESQLPKVPDTDPAIIALKASAGDVVKVTRKGETGEYVNYRVVMSM